ncbi:LysR family transcriptional regulator [Radicibacter daui]|uniref:LysR family transcriptional regulator n=1 Tax=Radicibacter daui TaxID=3064829 RepID=UPI004046BD3F
MPAGKAGAALRERRAGPMLARMEHTGIELRLLSKFVLACQDPSLSRTARQLGIAPSALSTALHGLEERVQMKLFMRSGRYLGLLPSAFWLYRNACALLHLEDYALRAAALPPGQVEKLQVRVNLTFAIGRLSKAISRAIQQMGALHPEVMVACRFLGAGGQAGAGFSGEGLDHIPPERSASIEIGCFSPEEARRGGGVTPLYDDPWIVVRSADVDQRMSAGTDVLALMKMAPPLMRAAIDYADKNGLGPQLKLIEEEPAELGRLLADFPHMRFLLPASMVANRLGLSRIHREDMAPPLSSMVGMRISGELAEKARLFADLLGRNIAGGDENIVFAPQLSARQLHYFNLSHRCGGISAAARVANIAQSSVSAQIHAMEEVLGAPLFERRSNGVVLSPAGVGLLPLTLEMERRQNLILRQSRDIAAHTQDKVAIGTLPSSGHDSALTEKVAEAMTAISQQHPLLNLQISEGSNGLLHERVRSGDLNLAIVGVVQPQFARVLLGPSEPLSVVANPALDFGGRQMVNMADVSELPLVLGSRHLSIHQSFIAAANARHVHIQPAVEVGSLALAIAMVRRARLCTVLPASSVRQDLEAGRLIAVQINPEEISGTLSVIFSAERELSYAERAIINILTQVFGQDRR